jgi:catechol 2,3-dioxygenase-like lactoylglutathione lyase family enzyme
MDGLGSLTLHNLATVVSDLDAAVAWYERVLGFSLEARGEIAEGEVALLRGANAHLELLDCSHLDEPPIRLEAMFAEPPGHLLVIGAKAMVFEVDDLARASAELEDASVAFLWRETEIAPGWLTTAIRDPDGNLINIEQCQEPKNGGGLASLALHNVATVVSDLEAAIAWYERVLGFRYTTRTEIAGGAGEVAFLSGAGVQLELLASGLPEPPVRLEPLFAEPPRHLLPIANKFLVFEVDDLARASAELAELAVTFVWREKELAPGFMASAIRDVDGNLVNILQRH